MLGLKLGVQTGVKLEVKLGVKLGENWKQKSCIGLPKMEGWIHIGLPKMHERIRIGLPKVNKRFRIGPPQVFHSICPHMISTVREFRSTIAIMQKNTKITYLN